ncbi:hypothetical protein LINPERPRIM_LOCUS4303 [Linum perenne]
MEKLNFFVVLMLLVSVGKMDIGAEAGRTSTTGRRGGGVLEPPCEVPGCPIGCFCEDDRCICANVKHTPFPTSRVANNAT